MEQTDHAAELLAWLTPAPSEGPAERAFIDAVRQFLTATLDELLEWRAWGEKAMSHIEEMKALTHPLIDNCRRVRETFLTARPLSEWCEEYGPCLWWRFPVDEPPYVGTPLDRPQFDKWDNQAGGWPGYHTHWTPIFTPTRTSDECR